jgi:hypothetical protein
MKARTDDVVFILEEQRHVTIIRPHFGIARHRAIDDDIGRPGILLDKSAPVLGSRYFDPFGPTTTAPNNPFRGLVITLPQSHTNEVVSPLNGSA